MIIKYVMDYEAPDGGIFRRSCSMNGLGERLNITDAVGQVCIHCIEIHRVYPWGGSLNWWVCKKMRKTKQDIITNKDYSVYSECPFDNKDQCKSFEEDIKKIKFIWTSNGKEWATELFEKWQIEYKNRNVALNGVIKN